MAQRVLSAFVQLLRRAAARHARDERADGELLARFVDHGDEAAFEILVHRHGPLVWSICRRFLTRTEEAEDAYQATFLVFLRKAASIRQGGLLSNWLYGVAYRVAFRARANATRRGAREKQGLMMEPAQNSQEPAGDWQPVLHEEVFRLPEKYRRPIVLCYLNGKTSEEAARDLGWPVGTVKGRLSRARDLLRGRLSRRGITLSATGVATTLAAGRLEALAPAIPLRSIVSGARGGATGHAAGVSHHALTLSQGVIHAMFLSKCAAICKGVVLLALIGAASGVSLYFVSAAGPNPAVPAEALVQTAQPKENPAPATSTAEDRKASMRNLQELALAIVNFEGQYGHFPPAAVMSKDGRPLLSWRVLVLPFVNEEKLFREFKQDEPWDSTHNKKLLSRMPGVYSPPKIKTKEPHATFYQVFTGKGTVFESLRGARINEITDGTSNTILMIEAAEAVPWTKPADLVYDQKNPLPRLGGIFPDGFHFARADGSVSFCKKRFREAALRDMVTRNGGEGINGNPDD
jgi:RNA polymerase sigma factor (sigma-70 family)